MKNFFFLHSIFENLPSVPQIEKQMKSKLLKSLFSSIPNLSPVCGKFLEKINLEAAEKNSKMDLFSDPKQFPLVTKAKNVKTCRSFS
jgi:hypothetical protein